MLNTFRRSEQGRVIRRLRRRNFNSGSSCVACVSYVSTIPRTDFADESRRHGAWRWFALINSPAYPIWPASEKWGTRIVPMRHARDDRDDQGRSIVRSFDRDNSSEFIMIGTSRLTSRYAYVRKTSSLIGVTSFVRKETPNRNYVDFWTNQT